MPTRGHPRVTRVRGAVKFQPGDHSRVSARSHLNHRPRCVTLSRTLHAAPLNQTEEAIQTSGASSRVLGGQRIIFAQTSTTSGTDWAEFHERRLFSWAAIRHDGHRSKRFDQDRAGIARICRWRYWVRKILHGRGPLTLGPMTTFSPRSAHAVLPWKNSAPRGPLRGRAVRCALLIVLGFVAIAETCPSVCPGFGVGLAV